jgi:hypothetical protein
MKNYLLDQHPNFGEEKISLDGNDYELRQVKGNGCYLTVIDSSTGTERDHICFSKADLKAIFMLLYCEK